MTAVCVQHIFVLAIQAKANGQISREILGEAVFFLVSVLVGAGLFLLYDSFRIFRRIVPHGTFWIGIEDICYWLICTVVVFLLLYLKNDGMIRGFAIGGVVVGMLLYFLLVSRFVVGILTFFLKKIVNVTQKMTHMFFAPVWRVFRRVVHFLGKQLKKIGKAIKMGLCKL